MCNRNAIFCISLFLFLTFKLSVAAVYAQVQTVEKRFNGKEVLECSYGITSHITWRGYDYDNYERNLDLIKGSGTQFVRFDLNYGDVNWGKTNVDFDVFDRIINTAYSKDLQVSPIFSPSRYDSYTPEYAHKYTSFVGTCLKRYGNRVSTWEIWNEMDVMNTSDGKVSPDDYIPMLKDAYKLIKQNNSNNTVLLGAIGSPQSDYFKRLLSAHTDSYYDALSIHYYSAKLPPEDILTFFSRLEGLMKEYSVDKPVWLTETGYSTNSDKTDAERFYTHVLPEVYNKLGIDIGRSTLGILYDNRISGLLANQDNPALATGFRGCKLVLLSLLKEVAVSEIPVMMVLFREKFPIEYFEDLRSYIAKGGTVVFPEGGAPLYYNWDLNTNQTSGNWKNYCKPLHIDYLFTWEEKGKKRGLESKMKSVAMSSRFLNDYSWTESDLSDPNYLTDKNLKSGDQFIPIMKGTDGNQEGVLAACYKLDSDLKGNIIIQTRHNNSHQVSEELQAIRIPRVYLLSYASGVDKVYYYALRNRFDHDGYGIIKSDLSEKQAYFSLKALTVKCPGGSTRPTIKTYNHQYIASWVNEKGKKVYCVWSDLLGVENGIEVKGRAKYYDIYGRRIKRKAFTPGPSVIYIEDAKSVCFK